MGRKCSIGKLGISLSYLIFPVAVNTKYVLEVMFLICYDNIFIMSLAGLW